MKQPQKEPFLWTSSRQIDLFYLLLIAGRDCLVCYCRAFIWTSDRLDSLPDTPCCSAITSAVFNLRSFCPQVKSVLAPCRVYTLPSNLCVVVNLAARNATYCAPLFAGFAGLSSTMSSVTSHSSALQSSASTSREIALISDFQNLEAVPG